MSEQHLSIEDVLDRARRVGVTIDDDYIESVHKTLDRSLATLDAFNREGHRSSEPATSFSAAWDER